MNQPPDQPAGNPGTPGSEADDVPGSDAQPSQEELRARLEEQLRQLRVEDLLVESIVSVLNLTARRIAKEDERDLEQAQLGIEAIRAWSDLIPPEAAEQIRNALSELQLLYAQAAGGGEGQPAGDPGTPVPPRGSQQQPPPRPQPGRPGEPPPRLWTPPGTK
jgi:hypothetical protein